MPTAPAAEPPPALIVPREWTGLLAELQRQAQALREIVPGGDPAGAQDLARIATAAAAFQRLLDPLVAPAVHSGGGTLAVEDEAAEPADPAATAGDGEASGPPARVLVVDDDEGNRLLLERHVRRLGHTVACATQGQEALALLRQSPFDLILLDIQMPVLDGQQTLEILRTDPALRRIPAIVLSASREISRVARCIELGAEDYLPKPFNVVLLRARIHASLERKQLRDREAEHLRRIEAAQRRAEELLHVILPRDVVLELAATERVKPRALADVAVLFTDLAGFTEWCAGRSPAEVHAELQALVEGFEEISLRHGLEKIKTIGDSFMATAGLIGASGGDPALAAVACGLEMIGFAARTGQGWHLRVGVHAGPVSAGIVGRHKYQFDLWGDTVNTASRMEQAAAPGSVCVDATTWARVAPHCRGRPLGSVTLKGKGARELFRIDALARAPGAPEPAR
ncbi:MAG: adenylate/guanylate cyclase domain-containing protein [Opitutaceae bacterium]